MNAQTESHTRLHGRWLLIARLAWAAVFITLTAMYAFGFLGVRDALSTVCEEERCTLKQQIRHTAGGDKVISWSGPNIGYADRLRPDQVEALETLGLTLDQYGLLGALQMGIPVLLYLLIAAGLFWWKSNDWMVLFVSVMVATFPIPNMPLAFTLVVRQPIWEWITYLLGAVALCSLLNFPLVFPNGQFVPRWTRWKVLFDIAFVVILELWRRSILTEPPSAEDFGYAYAFLSFCTSAYALFYRYFRVASPVERQQIKWVVAGLVGFLSTVPLDMLLVFRPVIIDSARALVLSAIPDTLFLAISLFIPVSIAISVLRYRLWDIDIIISRTLVYGALTACIVALYILLVGALSLLSQTTGNLLISLLATGLIAFLFQPLRDRLQRGVNHLLYGERDDPYVVLSQLGQRLETALAPTAILSTIVETIGRALKLPFVEIRLSDDKAQSVSFGEPQARTIAFPLAYQNESVGELHVAPRVGESLSSADHNLLKDFARQTGTAIHAARVTVDLQRSREQLVLTREEERRRLRRDLHDDLGPTLASLSQRLDTARNLIPRDPKKAGVLLGDLKKQVKGTITEIRRLAYALRPPALDELGLVGALREHISQYDQPDGTNVSLEAPDVLPALPAAVEVAAYYIVLEAFTNVARHAHARGCCILLSVAGGLCLEISDDGKGLPATYRAGVGHNSMRERVAELGGEYRIEKIATGGTRVWVRLPLPAKEA